MNVDLVIPTIGRASLHDLLASLDAGGEPLPERVIVVDDRPAPADVPLPLGTLSPLLAARIEVLRSGGRGPAAARNFGWHRARAAWVAFLDDDVRVAPEWTRDLAADLAAAPAAVAGTQGSLDVPLPADRRPTDWERNVAGLAEARFITADCAYRRTVLAAVGGFDERFPRAYREDADLALRIMDAGWRIERGRRRVVHPVRPAGPWISVRLQAGNADDALMRALHGPDWYERAGATRGAFRAHGWTVACALAAALASGAWAFRTAAFAARRIAPGPRTPHEMSVMAVTSAVLPFAAVWHRLRGTWRARRERRIGALLFDRDGTLIADVPDLRDPAHVRPLPGAAAALRRARRAGLRVGVVSNQPAVAEGRVTAADLTRVHARVETLLGPIDAWAVCTHASVDACACRKPEPAAIAAAAHALGIAPQRCVMVGDIGSDVAAARAAGARAILVPTPVTRYEEIAAAPVVAANVERAVDLALRGIA